MKKTIILSLYLFAGLWAGWLVASMNNTVAFANLNPQEMHELLIKQRDVAIKKAKEAGDYKCCIEPACTMCYMEANKWNNHTAGTCACDDIIAQGGEPCPQCKRGFCAESSLESNTCEL